MRATNSMVSGTQVWGWVVLFGAVAAAPSARAQQKEAAAVAAAVADTKEGDAPVSAPAEAESEAMTEQMVEPEIFDLAIEDYYDGRYAQAAAGFWGYINFGEPSAEKYEWAQYFLAESLRHLGFWHAAVMYYHTVAKTRSRPEILPDALGRLEAISRRRPFSESLVYEDLLYDSEFGFIPQTLNDWVQFVQGLYDYRNEFIDWANLHFSRISRQSRYHLEAMYVEAVYALKNGKDDQALAMFDSIVQSEIIAPEVKNRANLSLARLLFDTGRYKEAFETYGKVEQVDLTFEQAALILEKAWAAYFMGDRRTAMGLLHALDAPSYDTFFLPDAFVLRGLIFKDLCHFIPAKRVIRSFRFKYQRAIDQLRRRAPMTKIIPLLNAATQDGRIGRRTALLRTLELERRLIEDYDSYWEDVELDKHLRRVYDLEIREQSRLWRMEFEKSADDAALQLLEVEEQVNLLDYEIGLDIFKRLKAEEARRAKENPLVIPYDSANVYYEFDEEYWNDELHSYKYFITTRCFSSRGTP